MVLPARSLTVAFLPDSLQYLKMPAFSSKAFYFGLALVMLSLWMWFIPDWLTFIHIWRVELFASVFLFIALLFAFLQANKLDLKIPFSDDEQKFLILPLVVFILWSAASTIWAPSWKSAIHHTLVWSEYLVFYAIIRYLLEQRGQYRPLLYVFTATLLIYALPAIAGFVAISLFGGVNKLGIGFARFGEQVIAILPLVLVAVVHLKGRRFVLGTIAAISLWLFMFSTFGRANYLLFALAVIATGAFIFIFKRFHIYRTRFAIIAGAMMVATVLASSLSMFSFAEKAPRRFRDEAGLAASNNFRKLMITLSTEMISTHPIIGIGADNFGFEVNKYREAYAASNPNDPNLSAAESEIPERAHNEYLQIFAELGIVGIAIFAWFLAGIAIMGIRLLKNLGRRPLHAYASIIGIGLFLVSSAVTSYSFRLIQNGFVFFFVLAVAAKLLLSPRSGTEEYHAEPVLSPKHLRFACLAGMAACLLLMGYIATRVTSVIVTEQANSVQDLDDAALVYKQAVALDNENPEALRTLGMRLLHNERYPEAAEYLSRSVDIGLGTSTSFSYLASAYSLAGNDTAAEETMRKAAVYYPRSVFVLTRYSALLRENDKEAAAQAVFARAFQINSRSAKTWQSMLTLGAKATSDRSVFEKDILPVMDLLPNPAIYAVATERLIKFPEERRFSLMQVGGAKKADLLR